MCAWGALRRIALAWGVWGLLVGVLGVSGAVLRAEGDVHRFVPIGASYQNETLDLFVEQAITHNTGPTVTMRVLPITYATNPYTITAAERAENLALAQGRAQQIQDRCTALTGGTPTCVATAPDIQVRSDAENPVLAGQLGPGVEGIYILGGDQVVAMRVVANTPTESAMQSRYFEGAVVGGNSAGAAVQSRYMIAGYVGDNWPWNGLEAGALDLWYGATDTVTRGLSFGLDEAIVEQHVLERGRTARLLQAVQRSPGAKVGLGVDWGTGALVLNEQVVTQTAGYYAAVVLDEETYGAAASAQYQGPRNTLSIHNVAYHLLPEGPYGYDLLARRPIVSGTVDATAPSLAGRTFNMLALPAGAGPLMVTGDLGATPTGTVATRFATQAQAHSGPTVVLAAGFVTEANAIAAANGWATALSGLGVTQVQTATLNAGTNLPALGAQLAAAGEIFVTGDDQPIMAARVAALVDAPVDLDGLWRGGKSLLLDNAAAAAAGQWMSAEPTPDDDTLEVQSSDSFLAGEVTVQPGMNLLPGTAFEPRVLYDYLYGRLVSQVVAHPGTVAFGIERESAIEMTATGARLVGPSAAFVVDSRYARVLGVGTNDAFAATWLVLDTFADNDLLYTAPITAVELGGFRVGRGGTLGAAWLLVGVALGVAALWQQRRLAR